MEFGDALHLLSLDAVWFDVLLQGQRRSVKLIKHGTTIPTTESEVLDCYSDGDGADDSTGALVGVVVAEQNGRGLRFPLPAEVGELADKLSREVLATIDIDPGYRVRLTLKNRATGRTLQYRMENLLEKAVPVTVSQKVTPLDATREGGSNQASSPSPGGFPSQGTGTSPRGTSSPQGSPSSGGASTPTQGGSSARNTASGGAGASTRAAGSGQSTTPAVGKGTSSTDVPSTKDGKGKSPFGYVCLFTALFLAVCFLAYCMSTNETFSGESTVSVEDAPSIQTSEKDTSSSEKEAKGSEPESEKEVAKDKESKKSKAKESAGGKDEKDDKADKADEDAADEAQKASAWGPLNESLPDDFPNPLEGEFGIWADGTYTSEALGIRIESTKDVIPAKVYSVEQSGERLVLYFDMGRTRRVPCA